MAYAMSTEQLIQILHRYRWQYEKGEAEFEGLDVNLLIETAVDRLSLAREMLPL